MPEVIVGRHIIRLQTDRFKIFGYCPVYVMLGKERLTSRDVRSRCFLGRGRERRRHNKYASKDIHSQNTPPLAGISDLDLCFAHRTLLQALGTTNLPPEQAPREISG